MFKSITPLMWVLIVIAIASALGTLFITGTWGLIPLGVEVAAVGTLLIISYKRKHG